MAQQYFDGLRHVMGKILHLVKMNWILPISIWIGIKLSQVVQGIGAILVIMVCVFKGKPESWTSNTKTFPLSFILGKR